MIHTLIWQQAEQVDSTNAWAWRYWADHRETLLPHQIIGFVARQQTAGRGAGQGRTWASPSGVGVYLSLLCPEVPVERIRSGQLPGQVARACRDWLNQQFPQAGVWVKGPNDLYRGQGKLGGILVEPRWRPSAMTGALVVGIGINLLPADRPGVTTYPTATLLEYPSDLASAGFKTLDDLSYALGEALVADLPGLGSLKDGVPETLIAKDFGGC